MNEADSYKVFVSHATPDKWLATKMCQEMDAISNVMTFRDDRDIDGGDDIPEAIGHHIRSSKEMVLLLTPHSVGRQWPLLEVGAAALGVSRTMRITVVRCHVDIDPIPAMLKSKKSIELNEFEDFLEALARRAKEANNE